MTEKNQGTYGRQTELSLKHFAVGTQKMPRALILAILKIKRSAALVNLKLEKLDKKRTDAIVFAIDNITSMPTEKFDKLFPLSVWQTGSGTQTNMNVNEVIASLTPTELQVHPNDHVNMSQSTNDVFPTAIHICAVTLTDALFFELDALKESFDALEKKYQTTKKIGRTHLMDATPMTFAQEISGWKAIVTTAKEMIFESKTRLAKTLPIGGTAVGTGINAPKNFGCEVCKLLGAEFLEDTNKFHGLSSKDELLHFHGTLKVLSTGLMKIANDLRLLASGPRCGLFEITIPENEPGSSIMPGKVNPTQCEMITMIACEVIGNDTAVTVAAAGGQFQLNAYMPVIAFKICESLDLLIDGVRSFNKYCVSGIKANETVMKTNVERSLMLATALTPMLGYDKVSEAVKLAHNENKTLREIVVGRGYLDGETFDRIISHS